MTVLTSTGAVNLTSSTNWSPAQIPVAGDDLIIGAHTLTLDANLSLNTITLNNASARFAVSGTTRVLTVTNGITLAANLSAQLVATALASGVSLTINACWKGAFALPGIASSTGGNLTLQAVGGASDILFENIVSATARVITPSWSAGTLTTVGRFDLRGWSGGSFVVTRTGGTWNHTHTGISYFGDRTTNTAANGLIDYVLSGATVTNWSGETRHHSSTDSYALFYIGGTGTVTVSNGPIVRSGTGAVVRCLGVATINVSTPLLCQDRSMSVRMDSGGILNWRNQSLSIPTAHCIVIYALGTTVTDLTDLVVTNSGRFMYLESGSASVVVGAVTSISNVTTTAQACVVSNSGALDGRVVNLASDAPTLPTVSQVAGGIVYGYAATPLTGTGVISDPAVIAAAVGTALTPVLAKLPESGRAATAADVSINPTVLSLESVSDIRNGLGTTAKQDQILEAIDALETGGLTPTQAEQMNRLEAQTSKLSGSPVTVNGNVKPGGQIVLKHGDNHLVSLLNPVPVPVDDVGGSLYALMNAVGVNNIGVAAIRGADPASRISGTVAALNYASNILTVTMEFTAAETAKGVVGPVYTYDVYRLDNPTRTYFSGKLTVTRDARP